MQFPISAETNPFSVVFTQSSTEYPAMGVQSIVSGSQYKLEYDAPATGLSQGAAVVTISLKSDPSLHVTYSHTVLGASSPELVYFSPSFGFTTGGDEVYVSIKNYPGCIMQGPCATGPNVTFGDSFTSSATAGVTYGMQTTFLVTAPAFPAASLPSGGSVGVGVTLSGGAAISGCTLCRFKYKVPPVPAILSLYPTTAPTSGGEVVHFSVINIGAQNGAQLVFKIGGSPTTVTVTTSSAAMLTASAVVPAGLSSGAQQIAVYWSDRTGAQATANNIFAMYAAFHPRVQFAYPSEGYVSGNTAVTLTVSDLLVNGALPTDASSIAVKFCAGGVCQDGEVRSILALPSDGNGQRMEVSVYTAAHPAGTSTAEIALASDANTKATFEFL